MQTQYDPAVIVKLANTLYKKAEQIVGLYTFVFGLIAGCGGLMAAPAFRQSPPIGFIAGAIVGALVGYMIGTDRAFSLRVQAQMALCQKQIEENTRS